MKAPAAGGLGCVAAAAAVAATAAQQPPCGSAAVAPTAAQQPLCDSAALAAQFAAAGYVSPVRVLSLYEAADARRRSLRCARRRRSDFRMAR